MDPCHERPRDYLAGHGAMDARGLGGGLMDMAYTIDDSDKLAVIANSTAHAKNAASGGHLFITQI